MDFIGLALGILSAGAKIVETGSELMSKRNAEAAELQAAIERAGDELQAALLALRQSLPQHDAQIDSALARMRAKLETVLPTALSPAVR